MKHQPHGQGKLREEQPPQPFATAMTADGFIPPECRNGKAGFVLGIGSNFFWHDKQRKPRCYQNYSSFSK